MIKNRKIKVALVIIIITIIIPLTLLAVKIYNNGSKLPIIKNLMVEFGPYNPNTGKAGAFIFDENEDKIFFEFGAEVESPNGKVLLPTFEYRTDPNAKVFAVADGIITEIKYQADTDDYEILAASSKINSGYTICYDHIKNITVKKGKTIKAGHQLGTVGNWDDKLGRTELMINIKKGNTTNHYCPFKFFDKKLIEEYKNLVTNLMTDWEEFKGDSTIYDESKDIWPGCPYEELKEKE